MSTGEKIQGCYLAYFIFKRYDQSRGRTPNPTLTENIIKIVRTSSTATTGHFLKL